MGRHTRSGAGRAPAARAAVAAAVVAGTVLLGFGYAQANPEVTSPDRPAAASRPAPDGDAAREAPRRVPAGAPRPPQTTPRTPAPPAAPSGAPLPVAGTPCTVAARACVALNERRAWLLDAGKVVRGPVPIQHGDVKDPTPRGLFRVQWKAEQYTSREYLTQMPYSVFFADGGIAFHEGPQDNPSAGCVKLGHEDAKAFFYFLQVGDEVQIH
jgi:lipoprotein-anchoring transpeptidase ErfK/SrfK